MPGYACRLALGTLFGPAKFEVSIDAAEAEALYKTSLQRCWMPSMGLGLNPQS